ncbi:MAG: alpha/beta hydrolase [Bifidobacteriaceae bacterium]|jgi:pimeloyl-ACP methyl ester carboxylesterase|nr:alpha/beta hydrolase [Bifidobacteriaceae bacterium]
MTILAVQGAGTLRGTSVVDQPAHDSWAQDDETSRLSRTERSQAAPDRLAVPRDTVPLVLLHAYPLSSLMWAPLAAELTELPVLTVDLPGAGFSPTVEPVTIRAAGLAVIESLKALGVRRAVVVGVSMGGYVVMSLLRDAPGLMAGVVLMHTKAEADDAAARAGRLATARQVLESGTTEVLRSMASKMVSAASQAAQPGLVETIEHWIDQATPGGVAWAAEAMAGRDDAMAVLRAAGVPSTVVAGAVDPFVSVAQAEAMADALGPESDLVIMADVAHLSPVETPNTVARAIREAYRRMVP